LGAGRVPGPLGQAAEPLVVHDLVLAYDARRARLKAQVCSRSLLKIFHGQVFLNSFRRSQGDGFGELAVMGMREKTCLT